MKLTINTKEYELYFGVGFVRELDANAGVSASGVKFGMGLTKSLPALRGYDPAVLADVIYAATVSENSRPSQKEVDNFIDTDADLEKLFADVQKEMLSANAVKLAVKNLKA